MRILLLTQLCEPEPHFKGVLFARELAKLGHEVEVLTGFPNYPGGRIYPGFRQRPLAREDLGGGVRLTRVPLYPSHDASALRRVANYASFAASATLYGVLLARRADVVYAYHPPLTVAMAGIAIGRLRRAPVVLDVQDLWPDSLASTGMVSSERVLRGVGRACRACYRLAARVVVLSPGFRRALMERGVPEDKIAVIPNWCDVASARTERVPDIDWSIFEGDAFTITFAGNMGPAQDLDTVLDAARLVAASDPRVRFVLVGRGIGVPALRARVAAEGLDNVHFVGQLAFEEIGSVLERSDALLVHLKKDPLFAITIPSKIQSSLAAGKPLLMAVEGDSAEIVRTSGTGVVAEPGSARGVADAALALAGMSPEAIRAMGERSRRCYATRFSIEAGCRAFVEVFESAVRGGKRPRATT